MPSKYLLAQLLFILIIVSATKPVNTQTVLLYKNTFESPLIAPTANCGPDLDATLVNTLWGGTGLGTGGGGSFQQVNTVETILIHGPFLQYTDDSPGAIFDFGSPGTVLDETTVGACVPGATSYTFNWTLCALSLDIAGSVDGNITIVFDLLESGYAAIDSIEISSSITASSVDATGIMNLHVGPNPFANELIINGTTANGEIVLFDLTGKEMIRQKTFEGEMNLNTEGVLPGIYLLSYRVEGRTLNYKVIKI